MTIRARMGRTVWRGALRASRRASAIGADSTNMFRDAAVSFSRANAEVLVRTRAVRI